MTNNPGDGPGIGALFGGVGVAVLMVACCAAPLLIAGGALAGIGGVLSNPWVIAAGVVLVIAALVGVARRGKPGGDCCPPRLDQNDSTDQKGPHTR